MTPVFDTSPEPELLVAPSRYRIEPRNWGMATAYYLNWYTEATGYRAGARTQVQASDPNCFFDRVILPEHASKTLTEVGSVINRRICFPLVLRIRKSKLVGPAGSMVIDVCLVDKIKTAVNPAIRTHTLQPPEWLAWTTKEVTESGIKRLVVRAQGSKTSLNRDGTWIDIGDNFAVLYREAAHRLLKTAQAFTRRRHTDITEAASAIDVEVQKRIVADRVAATEPIHDKFWGLGYNAHIKIFQYVMQVPQLVQPYTYATDNKASAEFYLPMSWAPTPTSLRLVDTDTSLLGQCLDPSLRQTTCKALYMETKFRFTLPSRLHKWIEVLMRPSNTLKVRQEIQDLDCLKYVRHIELHFETDVTLKYFEKYLGFRYKRMTKFMSEAMNGTRAPQLFEILSARCETITITLILPARWRMGYSDAYGACHTQLCKWVAKAAGACAAEYNLNLVMELKCYEDDLDPEEMEYITDIFHHPASTSWKSLGITEGQVLKRPPFCQEHPEHAGARVE